LVSEIIFRKYPLEFLQSTMIVGAEITRRRFARGAGSYEGRIGVGDYFPQENDL